MAKSLYNKKECSTIHFSDKIENYLLRCKECNQHSEIRYYIAKMFKLNTFAIKFKAFIGLPYLTIEQVNNRYKETQNFLKTIQTLYGNNAVTYLTQFL